ncbi:hypothetical protein EV667_3579 [Ancylobacter aquaticus]|uniref:Uncharacterized protein n=1 Tax=Ancylobacter aquaticus TaxID=100 RepID=A0A4R1HNT0_ANCAQ|nr:hypothetical protein [Ancylobacter aquaticus]TCK23738.1 hypothetical protein EV667_3579 [Ancylobacter aquaticus]
MNRLALPGMAAALAALLALSGPGSAQTAPPAFGPDALIIQAGSMAELTAKWCPANPEVEHVVVLPAALFVDSEQLICDGNPYKLYRLIEHDDPDDFEYFLDPPFTNHVRLGCDGKAGRTMKTVALNCRPLHPNP